jgi:hypothetical protein
MVRDPPFPADKTTSMTRRTFAAFLSMMCLAMIGKSEGVDQSLSSGRLSGDSQHIRNKRLFSLAAGTTTLVAWERNHLHQCELCQTMGSILIRSIDRFPHLKFKHDRN